jgi:predicted nuclease with TOPRIM domain
LGKFLNDNYNLSNSREEEKSFGIPYYDFKYRLKELFPENNIDNINNFIVSLEGKSFSYEEINKVFNDEKERLNKNIKEYPNYNEVFLEFSELSGSIRENYEMFISKLVIKDPEKASKAKNNNNYQIRNFFL